MKVSIIIPNYNGFKFLDTCFASVFKQSFTDFQVILVDNGSTDNSIDFTRDNYGEVKIIALSENYGFSRAINEGIKDSLGEYVVLLNNDTEAEVDWLSVLVNEMEAEVKLFSCSSKMVRFYERDIIDDAGDSLDLFGWAYKRGDGFPVTTYTKDSYVFTSCAGAAIYRRSVLEEIGYLDEAFFAYLEDVDLGYRAKINGYKNKYCSKAIIYHVASGTTWNKYNPFKAKLIFRNSIYLVYKNMPFIQLLINLPIILLGIIIKTIFYSRKKFTKIYLDGIFEGLKSLNKIKRTKFKFKNLVNYICIEVDLILATFKYIIMKLLHVSL